MPAPAFAYFIAHAGADLDFARSLYRLLKPRLSVWLDQEDLLPGDDWDREIPRAQRRSMATVVLVSQRYEAAYYLRDEVHAAIQILRQPGQAYRVVPVYLDGFPQRPDDVPYGLTVVHGLDAKALGVDGVAEKLIALAARMPGATPPPPMSTTPPPNLPTVRQIHDALCGLLDAQFTEILAFEAGDDVRYIAGPSASRSQRALDLALWAETQGPGTLSVPSHDSLPLRSHPSFPVRTVGSAGPLCPIPDRFPGSDPGWDTGTARVPRHQRHGASPEGKPLVISRRLGFSKASRRHCAAVTLFRCCTGPRTVRRRGDRVPVRGNPRRPAPWRRGIQRRRRPPAPTTTWGR